MTGANVTRSREQTVFQWLLSSRSKSILFSVENHSAVVYHFRKRLTTVPEPPPGHYMLKNAFEKCEWIPARLSDCVKEKQQKFPMFLRHPLDSAESDHQMARCMLRSYRSMWTHCMRQDIHMLTYRHRPFHILLYIYFM